MAEIETPFCPECEGTSDFPATPAIGRRTFIGAAAIAFGAAALRADTPAPARKPRPAEDLVRELFADLKDEQKKKVVLDYDHGAGQKGRQKPTRKQINPNRAALNIKIGDVYTKPQQELIERIVKAMCSGDEGYRQISRLGTWDASKTFTNCGALIFGDPSKTGPSPSPFAFLFTGHHMTLRCDGDTEEGPAFGGPIYYGHSPNGYSRGNVFNYQTRSAVKVYEALSRSSGRRPSSRWATPARATSRSSSRRRARSGPASGSRS